MRPLMLLMAFVVSSVSTHGQAIRASDEVTQADDRYLQLMRQPDRAGLGELLAKDAVFTTRSGAVLTIDDLLRGPTAKASPKDRKIRLHGDHTAIVTSTLESEDGTVRQLRVWIKDGDKWRLAAAQGTLVTQPPSK
jgi:Domain of unknown function (DUF4440)